MKGELLKVSNLNFEAWMGKMLSVYDLSSSRDPILDAQKLKPFIQIALSITYPIYATEIV